MEDPAQTPRLEAYVKGVTGEVVSLVTKQIGEDEYFALVVTNNGHAAEILLATDPTKTNPEGKKSAEEQVQEALTTVAKFVKHLEIYNSKGLVDETRYPNAVGKLVTFTSRNKRSKDGRYINTKGYYKGAALALIPVYSVPVSDEPGDLPF